MTEKETFYHLAWAHGEVTVRAVGGMIAPVERAWRAACRRDAAIAIGLALPWITAATALPAGEPLARAIRLRIGDSWSAPSDGPVDSGMVVEAVAP